MNSVEKKVYSIEQIDRNVLRPIYNFFNENPHKLGSVAILPDHYTNIYLTGSTSRKEAHSLDPVPLAIWDNMTSDVSVNFSENEAARVHRGKDIQNHLDLLKLMKLDKYIKSINKKIIV